MADHDYFSFDEVLANLKLEEDELKRLVSAGEIRAFRDKDTMRFKAEDVARLKSDQGIEEDLALDDLELELEDDLELEPEPAIAGDAEVEETLVLEEPAGVEEIVLEEAPAEEGGIEELDLGAAPAEPAAAPGPRASRGQAAAAAAPSRRAGRAGAEEAAEEATDSVGMIALLVIGIILLLVANFVIFDAVTGSASNPLSKAVANMFG